MKLRFLCVVLLGVLARAQMTAGPDRWTGSGPEGGYVLDMAVDPAHPNTVYVALAQSQPASQPAIYRSDDAGTTWVSIGAGISDPSVTFLAFDPYRVALYAATGSGRIFRTSDGGATWSEPTPGPGVAPISAILTGTVAIAVVPPGPVFVAGGGRVLQGVVGQFTSFWTDISDGLPGSEIRAIAGWQTISTLYAAVSTGVYRRPFGGPWANVSNGSIAGELVYDLEVKPGTGDVVYAATASQGVLRTQNGGQTWEPSLPLPFAVHRLAVSPAAPNTAYAALPGLGIYKTINGGDTWSPTAPGQGLARSHIVSAAPSLAETVYAGGSGEVHRSTNGGGSWQRANAGLRHTSVPSVAIDPSHPSRIYAGTSHGVVFLSTNAGESWIESSSGLFLFSVDVLAIHPSAPATIYAGGGSYLSRSTDGGANWSPLNFPLAALQELLIHPSDPTILYAATLQGVFKSTNSGADWTPASAGLTDTFVQDLELDPSDSNVLYAGTGSGVFRTSNGASSWSPAGLVGLRIDVLDVSPGPPVALFAGVRAGGLFRSIDGGAGWQSVGAGLPGLFPSEIAVDPANPSTVYVSLESGGVFKSTNSGDHFIPFSVGLPAVQVRALAISLTGRFLVAGTYGSGAFTYSITSSNFYTLTPCRLADTRAPAGPFGGPALASGAQRVFIVPGRCGIPAGARAVAANVAVTQTDSAGHLTAWVGGTSAPATSVLNFRAGQTRAANAVLSLGPSGDLVVRATLVSGNAHLILDVSGYFAP